MQSLFTYRQRQQNEVRKQGGSCPMLYALKSLDGLTLSESQRFVFFERVKKALVKWLGNQQFDYIVCLPSKCTLALSFARLIAELTGVNVVLPFVKHNVEMKSVPLHARSQYRPVSLLNRGLPLAGKRLLLVDDVIATGTTINTAKQALTDSFKTCEITVLALFSAK